MRRSKPARRGHKQNPVVEADTAMMERAAKALYRAFQAIGCDIVPEGRSLDQEEVIDAVTACGFLGGFPETYGQDKEAVAWLDRQHEAIQKAVCRKAFPHDNYGW
jgi:hypothetical protein